MGHARLREKLERENEGEGVQKVFHIDKGGPKSSPLRVGGFKKVCTSKMSVTQPPPPKYF